MNEKITFSLLVDAVAEKAGTTKEIAEEFLKEFFSLISSTLADGEVVKIKRIGTFNIVEDEAEDGVSSETVSLSRKIMFVPDKELADAINLPFSVFEPVVLPDDVSEEYLNESDESYEESVSEISDKGVAVNVVDDNLDYVEWASEHDTDDVASENEVEMDTMPVVSESQPDETDNNVAEELEEPQKKIPESEEDDDNGMSDEQEVVGSDKKSRKFLWGYLLGIASTLLVVIVIFTILKYTTVNDERYEKMQSDNIVETAIPAEPVRITDTGGVDSVDSSLSMSKEKELEEVAPTQPSDKIVYDTISTTRYLTTMAKEHYGNYHLWPYIYEENKAILGHPDRIRPGTRVVIPPASKYGIDASNPVCVNKAKKMGAEIYSRYRP